MQRKILICVILVIILMGMAGLFSKGFLTPKVGLCLSGADGAMESGLRDALAMEDYTVLVRNSENDPEKQSQHVKALLEKDVDVLVIQPVNAADVSEILQMAVETPVVFIGNEPANLGNAYYVGCDILQESHKQVQLLETLFAKADINGDRCVDYMVVSGPAEDLMSQLYVQNVTNAMENFSTEKLQEEFCDGTSAAAKTLCRQALFKYGRDLELILCSSDEIALGAITAVKDSGRTPGKDVIIFSIGTEEKTKEAIQTGALTAVIAQDTKAVYSKIMQVIDDLSRGKSVSQKNYANYNVLITEDVSK